MARGRVRLEAHERADADLDEIVIALLMMVDDLSRAERGADDKDHGDFPDNGLPEAEAC